MKPRPITTARARDLSCRAIAAAHAAPRWCRKELAHIRCEHTTGVRLGENQYRGRKETETENDAHLCRRALGPDTLIHTDAYGPGWAHGDLGAIKVCAETVLRVAKAILRTSLRPKPLHPTTPPRLPLVVGGRARVAAAAEDAVEQRLFNSGSPARRETSSDGLV